jgi:formyltetrahydrofolate synthetase
MHMITETDLTMEQAMSMLLTGGAVCPEVIRYSAPIPSLVTPAGTAAEMMHAANDVSAPVETSRAAGDLETFSSMSRAGFTWAPDQGQ